ncbi:DUF1934 domain-containing protein [Candidatus Soleaferrea massiliensis]|uniref:DUF1934 domain-containing protein n=1 Tax=Candidatus Soleaferrea massiliensis TaxID=1470354 RepID=UPI00058C5369|nr:DUF1934 domain-containing protein [Candidatus Soleaferrea massiliensis]
MKKDVLITIRGVRGADGETDCIELTTEGSFYKKADSYYIRYKESEATGFEGATTTLKVEGDRRVTMTRSGPARSQLVIENGKRHLCHYGTQVGDIMMGIFCNNIKMGLCEDGGQLNFKYTIDINSNLESENEIFINVEECKNQDV